MFGIANAGLYDSRSNKCTHMKYALFMAVIAVMLGMYSVGMMNAYQRDCVGVAEWEVC